MTLYILVQQPTHVVPTSCCSTIRSRRGPTTTSSLQFKVPEGSVTTLPAGSYNAEFRYSTYATQPLLSAKISPSNKSKATPNVDFLEPKPKP